MNLVIDIGNTQTKAAVFSGEKIIALKIFRGEIKLSALKMLLKTHAKINAAILCSVIKHSAEINKLLKEKTGFVELNEKTKLPVKNLYKTPATLGKDRLASAVGANFLFPGKNALVVDAGTCIKYDFVNAKNEYLGGAISPGIDIRFKALHNFTAQLPLIKKNKKSNLIGQSTEQSILSGVQNGAVAEIKETANQYRKKFNEIKIILTGGDAVLINSLLSKKNRIFAAPNLTLTGLNFILNFNHEK